MRYFKGDVITNSGTDYTVKTGMIQDMLLCASEQGVYTFFSAHEVSLKYRPLLNKIKALFFR